MCNARKIRTNTISSLTSSEKASWLLHPQKRRKSSAEGREDLIPLSAS